MSRTQRAIDELGRNHPISNRGHAYRVLAEAGLVTHGNDPASARIYTQAVKQYEIIYGIVLQKSQSQINARQRHLEDIEAHTMRAEDVRRHIGHIDEPDGLFWACWAIFKQGTKWQGELTYGDFAVRFKKKGITKTTSPFDT